MRTWNLAGGLLLAVALAAPFIVPRIGGIDTWKILLAIGISSSSDSATGCTEIACQGLRVLSLATLLYERRCYITEEGHEAPRLNSSLSVQRSSGVLRFLTCAA
jgi:hypothetical protein